MSDSPHTEPEPTNADVRFETSDVDTRSAVGFTILLGLGIVVTMAALWGLFWFLFGNEASRKQSEYPVAAALRQGTTETQRLPASGPRIEGFPREDPQYSLGRFTSPSGQLQNTADDEFLARYGWLNSEQTIAHIPIAEAMKRVAQSLPARKAKQSAIPTPSRNNSGREVPGDKP